MLCEIARIICRGSESSSIVNECRLDLNELRCCCGFEVMMVTNGDDGL